QGGQYVGRELQKTQFVGDGALAETEPARGLLLAEVEELYEVGDAARGLNEVEVLTLEVFDHGQQTGLLHVYVQDDAGDARKSRELGGAQPPFSGHELVAPVVQPHGDGLDK